MRRLRLPALRIDPGKLRIRRQGNEINTAWRSRFLLEAAASPGSALASIPAQEPTSVEVARQGTATPVSAVVADIVAHIRNVGDLGGACGSWIGVPESGSWIEGFCITPRQGVVPADIEYHGVLDFGRPLPWASGGEFCGARGMTMPLRGICVRLRNAATATYQCLYSASFQDGSTVEPLQAGEVCQSTTLAPLVAFQIVISPQSQ